MVKLEIGSSANEVPDKEILSPASYYCSDRSFVLDVKRSGKN